MSENNVIKKSPLAPTILISNGISFLGLKLSKALLEKGARVVVLDKVDEEVRSRAMLLLSHPNFALFNVDPEKGVPEKIHSVDYIFALNYPDNYVLSNRNLVSEAFSIKGLLDLAVRSDAKFSLVEPLFSVENTSVNGPLGSLESYSYDKSSSFLHSLIRDYVENRDLNARITRLCMVYGPGMPLESSASLVRFVDSVVKDRNLRIYGDGIGEKYYLHVDDAVRGVLKAMFYKNTSDRIFKLLSDRPYADLELAFTLKGLANGKLGLEYSDKPFGELTFDPLMGETVPKWEPEIGLKEGLKPTLESFGYSVNSHNFKPHRIIEEKIKEENESEHIHSLSGLKGPSAAKKEAFQGFSADKPAKKWSFSLPPLPSLPKIKLPQFFSNLFSKFGSKFQSDFKVDIFSSGGDSKLSFSPKTEKIAYILTGLFFLFLVSIVMPLGLTALYAKRGVNSLEEVSLNLIQLQADDSEESAEEAFGYFQRSQKAFSRLHWVFKLTGKEGTYKSLNNLFESATYFSGSLYRTSRALDPFVSLWQVLRPNSPQAFATEDFRVSTLEFSNARKTLDTALIHYKAVEVDKLPRFAVPYFNEFSAVLNTSDSSLSDAQLLAGVLPELVGVDEEKNYLVLLQNSNELRPTGGFIGSYATLALNDGKIEELYLDDIYNPDGQIDSREIASYLPTPISAFLGEEFLHIRNANWDPDFPSSAETIEDLFFKIDGSEFDGVIALDLNLVKSLLDVTGPVFLAAYNEEISSENLYERTQYYSEFDYQEGISDKRSFLTVLGGKLLERLFALPPEKMGSIISEVKSSLESRHLMASVENPTMKKFLAEKKWNGAMVTPEGDYLMVVNANLGGTKANYFVENSYDYSVTSDTRDGLLRSHLTLNYKHNGEDNAWPGGPYTDYLRVYVPKGARLTSATQSFNNGRPQNITGGVVSYNEEEYTVFAKSFVLRPQQELRLTLDYDLPDNVSFTKESKDYSLYWQKQPGTQGDIFRFDFKGPFGTDVATYTPQDIVKTKNMATLEGLLNADKQINLILK